MKDSMLISVWLASSFVLNKVDKKISSVHGIGFDDYVILSMLHAAESGLNSKVLAEKVFKSASSTMRLLISMEKTGIVSRRTIAGDSLNSIFEISSSGEDLFLNAACTMGECSEVIFSNLDEDKKSNLCLALDEIRRA